MYKMLGWGVGIIFLLGIYASFVSHKEEISGGETGANERISILEEENQAVAVSGVQGFITDGLLTDTSLATIDLGLVLDGGPGKDGIPAIYAPKFLSQDEVEEKMAYISAQDSGIVVVGASEQRFYPYAVLNRHEIINDRIDDRYIAVTFCPLCGSAIVFDRTLDEGQVVHFGVSGKLYQSNLLMYDDETETLWSQAKGEGVVGHYVGEKLVYIDSDSMIYEQFQSTYPGGVVLSDDTGHSRDYTRSPYGNYDENDRLYFPVENVDARLPTKEILYVVPNPITEQSIAFVRKELVDQEIAILTVDGETYEATMREGDISVLWSGNGEILPGYHEMFFSWATHNPDSKYIWMGEEKK